jgi:hypothetical protein
MLDHILHLHNLHHISLLIARGNLLIVSSQGNRYNMKLIETI